MALAAWCEIGSELSPAGFEPATFGSGGRHSIQLSYGDLRSSDLESTPGPSGCQLPGRCLKTAYSDAFSEARGPVTIGRDLW
jgi:hypothetical protein